MTFLRLTKRQSRLTGSIVIAVMTMNLVISVFTALGTEDFRKGLDSTVISGHHSIDEHGLLSGDDPTTLDDERDNPESNSDGIDDCTFLCVAFSIDRGEYFGLSATWAFIGHSPAPDHRPPNRR